MQKKRPLKPGEAAQIRKRFLVCLIAGAAIGVFLGIVTPSNGDRHPLFGLVLGAGIGAAFFFVNGPRSKVFHVRNETGGDDDD